mmetsp:Transcript_13428/g.19356  ORF Transcript_13428/g.19356 Transcript_13428/m.19356 type:complete len:466 (-) Transcript_13428:543-1940(-)
MGFSRVGFVQCLYRGTGLDRRAPVTGQEGFGAGEHAVAGQRRTCRVFDMAEGIGELVDDDGLNEPAVQFFSELPVKKIFCWLVFLFGVYSMRSFFPVALGTFIVGYIGNSFVQYFSERTNGKIPRKAIVLAYYSLIISIVALLGITTIPKVISEGQYFIQSLQSSNPYVFFADGIRSTLGDDLSTRMETFLMSRAAEGGAKVAPPLAGSDLVWTRERSIRFGGLLQSVLKPYAVSTATVVSRLLAQTTRALFTAILSLIFSAMIVWDLKNIAKAARGLAKSRFRAAYKEISPYVLDFFTVLGKSFEAQTMIALVNTSLSTMGILFLGLKGVWFLSVVVLVCSFIPVAGVFVSTLPMVVVALSEYGASKALWVVLMVIGVHAIEAYFLNPQIYSAHLKLHPLFVITVLYMWEHLYGPPGLILGVPVTVYLLRNVIMGSTSIRKRESRVEAELEMKQLEEDKSPSIA